MAWAIDAKGPGTEPRPIAASNEVTPMIDNTGQAVQVGRPWADHAEDLTRWLWARLVNRTDAWGAYRPLALRDKLGNSWTAPPKRFRGQAQLGLPILQRHCRGELPEHTI